MKLTKKLWLNGELWDVVQVLRPTKYDVYILVQRKRIDQIHCETKVNPINMRLIDCGNDVFYPDTKEVRELLEKINYHTNYCDAPKRILEDMWLNLVNDVKIPAGESKWKKKK